MHHSLSRLAEKLKQKGARLIFRKGKSLAVLEDLLTETGAAAVYWNRRYEPSAVTRDTAVKSKLTEKGIRAESFNGSLLFEPWTLKTGAGGPYQVFTPYWRACLGLPPPPAPLAEPSAIPGMTRPVRSDALEEWSLLPTLKWDAGFHETWKPGEEGAKKNLSRFQDEISNYPAARDIPKSNGTSRLSPHLHFGEISPRQIWEKVQRHAAREKKPGSIKGAEAFLREIGWREFAHHLLFHFPHTAEKPLRPAFEKFPWEKNRTGLKAWQEGKTGYPIVDAGMRELWATGWMHNRVRMIAASFLVKDLRISWIEGARWFWDTLVDADLASNTLGWQWSAGCGADAAPYFRIFNPASQAEKFDPDATYIRRWVPELGTSAYPPPILNHAEAREAALIAFQKTKS